MVLPPDRSAGQQPGPPESLLASAGLQAQMMHTGPVPLRALKGLPTERLKPDQPDQ